MNYQDIEILIKIKRTCNIVIKQQNCHEEIKTLKSLIDNVQNGKTLQNMHQIIICSFYPMIKRISENKKSINQDVKCSIVETLNALFARVYIDRLGLFLNLYGFLLNEIYDSKAQNCVAATNEEYKLLILECTISLAKCLSSDVVLNLYTKEHAPKLCQMLYVALSIAKTEQLRKLRITAIRCITTFAKVHDDNDNADAVLRAQIADVFILFLPGVASGLRNIALEDEKFGHGVVVEALRAFGKLVKLIMENPECHEESHEYLELNLEILRTSVVDKKVERKNLVQQWKNEAEIKDYLQSMKRDKEWFQETDGKLKMIINDFTKLTYHSHPKVREGLSEVCTEFVKTCSNTMVLSMCCIAEILIILTQDDYETVSRTSKDGLDILSKKFSSNTYKALQENLEERFYETVTDLPRIFNSLDEQRQLSAVNMLAGYLQIFGQNRLVHVLHSPAHLKRLIFTLISISRMETSEVTQLEDHVQNVFEDETDYNYLPNYKKFKYIQNQAVISKLEVVCSLLVLEDVVDIVIDSLVNVMEDNEEDIREAIYILNEVLSGLKGANNAHIFENIIKVYLDSDYWNLPLHTLDKDGTKYTLGEIQNNILQVCLLVEGLGKIASTLGSDVERFLLKIMYPILERAGSPYPLIRRVGLAALANLSSACGYHNITELINANSDYFSYHVVRKIQKVEQNENVLNVLCVVMQHSSNDVLPSISDIIEGILIQTYDKYFQERRANPYLHVFKTFIFCLMRWLGVKPNILPIKSKIEKEREAQYFKVSNIEEVNTFGDEIMGKTAEEMYKEDLEKSQKELEDKNCDSEIVEEEYKKPNPPTHIKLTVLLLKRCLHFLPAKNRTTKLLVLEILKNGYEIIRDWDDELLPLVHQVWSPLVNRFKDTEEPVVINYSFQLLVTLARLSKNFIRSRTAKEVLPDILKILEKLSSESYLKDRGSAYRYTQAYKLQLTILEDIGRVAMDIDMGATRISSIIKASLLYLSDRQPVPLQELTLKLFKELLTYDEEVISAEISKLFKEKPFTDPEFLRGKTLLDMFL